jgi:hypothetical protein
MTAPFSRKWSVHGCCPGLNSGTRSPAGDTEATFEPLYRLQTIHAYARLSAVVAPPCCRLMM